MDGIVLMPVDGTALARVAQEAADAGIPVVIADSGLDWDGKVSFVATDNRELEAEGKAKQVEGKGQETVGKAKDALKDDEKDAENRK